MEERDASSSEDDENDAPVAAWRPPDLAQLQQQADDDDSDDEEGQPPPAEAAAATEEGGAAAEAEGGGAGASDGAEGSSSGSFLLPSALDALGDQDGQDFLHQKYTPEFDASKQFKPPPMTTADLGPVYGTERTQMGPPSVPPPRGWQGEHTWKRQDEAQHYSHSYGHGTQPGAVRVRGSVCHETDDERGRRVRYGAHAMLARA